MKGAVLGLGHVGAMAPGRRSAQNHDVWEVGVSLDERPSNGVEALRGYEGVSR